MLSLLLNIGVIMLFSEVRRRFCCIFSDIMMEIGKKMDTKLYTEALCLYNVEQQNFHKLLTDVIYTREETYCLYMNLAINSFNAIEIFVGSRLIT